MSMHLSDALSLRTTEWFHAEYEDDISPALTVQAMSNNFLRYLEQKKLKLSLDELQFRRFMCEAICTMYASAKECTTWQGPNSLMPRPIGWTRQNEYAWRDYISYMHFSGQFWIDFWNLLGEPAMWEFALPRWRIDMERILPHYVFCNPILLTGGSNASPPPNMKYEYTGRSM